MQGTDAFDPLGTVPQTYQIANRVRVKCIVLNSFFWGTKKARDTHIQRATFLRFAVQKHV